MIDHLLTIALLHVNGFGGEGKSGFFEGFGEGRVSVAGAGEIGRCGAHFEGEGRFGNEFAGVGGDDMDAEEGSCFGIGDHLDEAEIVSSAAGAGVGFEGKLAGFDGEPHGFGFRFGEANGSHFRVCVDDAGDGNILDMGRLTGDNFCYGHSLFGGFMGQHRAVYDVSDGIDVGMGGAEVVVDLDESPLIGGDRESFKAEALGVGTSSDRDEDNVC